MSNTCSFEGIFSQFVGAFVSFISFFIPSCYSLIIQSFFVAHVLAQHFAPSNYVTVHLYFDFFFQLKLLHSVIRHSLLCVSFSSSFRLDQFFQAAMPRMSCAHKMSPNKKLERVDNLITFLKGASLQQVSRNLHMDWRVKPQHLASTLHWGLHNHFLPYKYSKKTVICWILFLSVNKKWKSYLGKIETVYDCTSEQSRKRGKVHMPEGTYAGVNYCSED